VVPAGRHRDFAATIFWVKFAQGEVAMDFLGWLGAVVSAALRLSVDTTQIVIFLSIAGAELVTIFAPAAVKPAPLAVSTRLTTGRWALIALVAVIGMRLLLAPYWVWENEHQARSTAEAQNKNSAEQNQRRLAMKTLLSTAINEGGALSKEWFKRTDADAYLHEANVWTNKTGHLIEDAYGKGELAGWMSDAGIISFANRNEPAMKTRSWIINRLQRLNELMLRVDTLPMHPGFDPNNYLWVTECADC
jgi:hypothetical protein